MATNLEIMLIMNTPFARRGACELSVLLPARVNQRDNRMLSGMLKTHNMVSRRHCVTAYVNGGAADLAP